MSIRIGHAVMDVLGKTVGLTPGDQTGKEIATLSGHEMMVENAEFSPDGSRIVTIPHDDPRKMTVNLLGPIVINVNKMRAVQVVLVSSTSPFSHRHPVMSA